MVDYKKFKKSTHTVRCETCSREMEISDKYDKGCCWRCVMVMSEPPYGFDLYGNKIKKMEREWMWHLEPYYIDEEGTEFEYGIAANPKKNIRRVRGWQFMERWVDSDGTVWEKGKRKPELRGKYKPTNIKKIKRERKARKKKKKKKLSKIQREKILTKLGQLKKKLSKETDEKKIKKINKDLKRYSKKLNVK